MTETVPHDPRKGCKGCKSFKKSRPHDDGPPPFIAHCLRTGDAYVYLSPLNIHAEAPYWCPKWREKTP